MKIGIYQTCGGFIPMKMNKRGTKEIYNSRRSLDYTKTWWICTYEDELKLQNGNSHLPKKFGLYQRAVDLYLGR